MTKIQIHVNVDLEIYMKLKSRGINVSSTFNNLLYNYLDIESSSESNQELENDIQELYKNRDEATAKISILQSKLLKKKQEEEDTEKQRTEQLMAKRAAWYSSGVMEVHGWR